jgi:predicted glycosyltransferase
VLAQAFDTAGHRARVVSGGMPTAQLSTQDVDVVQLPALRSDGVDFTRLLDETGAAASINLMAERQQALLRSFETFAPDALITELFPFGRRSLAAEFLSLLDAGRARARPPLVCASIRDILAPPSKPSKAAHTDDLIERFYDVVLVHADAQITPLDESWPVTPHLARKLRYTGYVAPAAAGSHPDALGAGEVLISVGGGDVGLPVFRTALAAARRDPARRWRLLVGGGDAAARIETLRAGAPDNVTLEPARKDFRQMLHHAAASVSLCGYNTALDILQAGTPAVFVPFDAGNEREQGLRAQAMAHLPGIEVLPTDALEPSALLARLERVTRAPRRPPRTEGLDGAQNAVRIVQGLMERRS